MARKRKPGRPRKVEARVAARNQKAARRETLRDLGLVDVTVWTKPKEAAYLRRASRLAVAETEYMAALKDFGEGGASLYAERLRAVQEQNEAEVKRDWEEKARVQMELDRAAWRAKTVRRRKEAPTDQPVISFKGR